jgi:hypothetical protein
LRSKCYTRSGWIASSLYASLRLDLRLNIAAHNELPEINYLRLKEFEDRNIHETGGSEPCLKWFKTKTKNEHVGFQGCVLKPLQRTGLFSSILLDRHVLPLSGYALCENDQQTENDGKLMVASSYSSTRQHSNKIPR